MAELFLGLISGTSMDAVDAALVDFAGGTPRILHAFTYPLPDELRQQTLAFAHGGYRGDAVDQLGELDVRFAECFAQAANALLKQAGVSRDAIAAIGSHGQTVRHRPDHDPPFTLQIGDPSLIAARTGITTVADFRRRDIAEGGQGAPLMPAFHAAVLADQHEHRVVANIGGMANITVLPPGGMVRGFDTGPGNALLDAWIQDRRQQPYDKNGAWAAGGSVNERLLAALLSDAYFSQPPPKSTGRERFNFAWLQRALAASEPSPADVQATLAELTAVTLSRAILEHAPGTAGVLVCGGGARNADLLRRLRARLPEVRLESTARFGLDPDYVEAAGFAWLARETLAGRPGNLPAVTGARRAVVLGSITYP